MSETPASWIAVAGLFGLMFGMILIAYDDGVPFGLYKRICCKLGKHTFRAGYKNHIRRYFCHFCKIPRQHPVLKAIDGGKKDFSVPFKF